MRRRGGTTDFTLIALREADGSPRFERIAVGDHLILGGDNMDFSIAGSVAGQLGKTPQAMGRNDWKALCHQCRQIKERILEGESDSGRITIMGAGSGLISGTMTARVDRSMVEAVVLDRFFPLSGICEQTELPTGDASWGLPYEADTAITGHLARFLNRHREAVQAAIGRDQTAPDLILFNGGALKATILRSRIQEALKQHFSLDTAPRSLDNREMDLAVSLGAAYYGMVKSGVGVRVGSGSPRSYYVGVGDDANDSGERRRQAVCLVERGLEEGSTIALPDRPLKVLANQPVSIDLFSSSYRSGDRSGDLVEVDDTLTALPALNTVIQYGSKGIRAEIPVNLEASYTEVGTLEIWCQSLSSPHRWQLRFQLRGDQKPIEVRQDDVFEASLVQSACETIRETFTSPTGKARLPRIMADIAVLLDRPREKWPLGLLRTLADTLLEHESARKKSAEAESRWMNLMGFCLRPGIGEGLDPHRVKTLWKQYKKGPVHATAPQVRLEWWILWRRLAAGPYRRPAASGVSGYRIVSGAKKKVALFPSGTHGNVDGHGQHGAPAGQGQDRSMSSVDPEAFKSESRSPSCSGPCPASAAANRFTVPSTG